jgi:hypothetical protein
MPAAIYHLRSPISEAACFLLSAFPISALIGLLSQFLLFSVWNGPVWRVVLHRAAEEIESDMA